VVCYSLVELFGEKLRALSERCRPRDLYDVVHMHRHPDLVGRGAIGGFCHIGIDEADTRSRALATRPPVGSTTITPRPAAMSWQMSPNSKVDLPTPVGPMMCRCRRLSGSDNASRRSIPG